MVDDSQKDSVLSRISVKFLFKPQKEFHCEQKAWIYINRTSGRHCHYCPVNGDIDAGIAAGQKTGKNSAMPGQPETMGTRLGNVHR